MSPATLSSAVTKKQVEQLRCATYNARVEQMTLAHEELMLLRVTPDRGIPPFLAGQYTVLGLGEWEARVKGVQFEAPDLYAPGKLIKRAYSISCSLIDQRGRLVRASGSPYLEFYIVLVRYAKKQPPALTPRLFALAEGDRLYCGTHVHGHYSLAGISRDDRVFHASRVGFEPQANSFLYDSHSSRTYSQ